MNFIVALTLFVATVTATFDNSQLKPRHINPKTHSLPARQFGERITNGEEASVKQFPYQVALLLGFVDGYYFCGGVLIWGQWILTAAHCTDNALNATAILGITKLYEPEVGRQQFFVNRSAIIVNENWNNATLVNDIALIKLPVAVQLTEYVQPAKLPKKSDSQKTFEGEIALASGWGKDSDAATTISPVLRYVATPVITNILCKASFLGSVKNTNICTSGLGGRSTCNGDSGGPLVIKTCNDNVVIGLTSFGIALGCELNWPSVYTRITSYLDWIQNKTGIVNQ